MWEVLPMAHVFVILTWVYWLLHGAQNRKSMNTTVEFEVSRLMEVVQEPTIVFFLQFELHLYLLNILFLPNLFNNPPINLNRPTYLKLPNRLSNPLTPLTRLWALGA